MKHIGILGRHREGLIKQIRSKYTGVVVENFHKYILDCVRVLHGELLEHDIYKKSVRDSQYITLGHEQVLIRDFIIRVGKIMKVEFGDGVWINLMRSSIDQYDASIVLYEGIKSQCEMDYITSLGGIVLDLDGETLNNPVEQALSGGIRVEDEEEALSRIKQFIYEQR